jgi:hypothetical protein
MKSKLHRRLDLGVAYGKTCKGGGKPNMSKIMLEMFGNKPKINQIGIYTWSNVLNVFLL